MSDLSSLTPRTVPGRVRLLRSALEAGLRSAQRQGRVVVMRGRRGNPDSRTLRLPGQPEVLLRMPGDRGAWSIPPAELTELGRLVLERTPDIGQDALRRQVAHILGWERYTTAIDELLEGAVSGPELSGESRSEADADPPVTGMRA